MKKKTDFSDNVKLYLFILIAVIAALLAFPIPWERWGL